MRKPLGKGKRVRILLELLPNIPTQGVIYGYCPSRPAPWYVRPDGWSERKTGIAFKSEELELVEEVQR